MLQPKSESARPAVPRAPSPAVHPPFLGAMEAVLVDDRGEFSFDGAVRRGEAAAVWQWLARDVAPQLVESVGRDEGRAALEAALPALLAQARAAVEKAAGAEGQRRLRVQLGGASVVQRLPVVLTAIRCIPLYGKAQSFGRAINGMIDDEALVAALQSMPRQDASAAAALMVAAVGEVLLPERLVVPATRIAGSADDIALTRAGFAPLVDAMLARAQDTIPPLLERGTFVDIDLACRSIERFHRLVRAISGYGELAPRGRWSTTIAALTKTVSDRLEPMIRDVVPAINQALRRQRDGNDWLDSDSALAALNGVYLLATVRDTRDSLAVNEVFDESWSRSAQVLEMHLNRNLDALKQNPADRILAARTESGIKMAEIRFGAEYADILRRAVENLGRTLG